jgi:hypothetical protein
LQLSFHEANSTANAIYVHKSSNQASYVILLLEVISLAVHRLPSVSRELLQLARINSLQLRATQTSNHTSDSASQRIKRPKENVWLGLSRELVDEATEVVAFEESSGVVYTTGEVGDVDAYERVGCAGVAEIKVSMEKWRQREMSGCTYPPMSRNLGCNSAALTASARKYVVSYGYSRARRY